MNQIAKKYFLSILCLSLFLCSALLGQTAELITQQFNVENAIRDKVSVTINKLVNRNDYVIIVNARMDLKPSFQIESQEKVTNSSSNNSAYTPIPGLLPSVPAQNIQEPKVNSSFNYSTDKYLLYGLDIAIYLDEDVATGALQQNIKRLVLEAIPEIIECDDCIRFETMQMNNNTDSSFQEMMNKIEKLEKEKRDGEEQIINWRYDLLEEKYNTAEDARREWEEQARERERQRDRADSIRMVELQKIEKEYRSKQDSLYQLTSFKLDKAIQTRIDSDAATQAQLIDIIKKGMSNDNEGDFSDGITGGSTDELAMQNSEGNSSNMIVGIVAAVILLLLMALLFIAIKNQKRAPVYLKPKTNDEANNVSNEGANNVSKNVRPVETSANDNTDVQRSELNSLRQSTVSMAVGQKDGATQIVKDWLNTESGGSDPDAEEESEKS